MSESRAKDHGSGPHKRNGMNEWWKWVAVAALGIGAGQFLPVVLGNAVSQSEIDGLKDDIGHLRREMGDGFNRLERKIDRDLSNHKEATAHDGALRLLIQHGQELSEVKSRQQSHERGHP